MHAIGGLLERRRQRDLAGRAIPTRPYAGGERGYSNWELSTDRANASRRELVAGGMNESKVLRVVGLASQLPLDAAEPARPDQPAHQPRRAERRRPSGRFAACRTNPSRDRRTRPTRREARSASTSASADGDAGRARRQTRPAAPEASAPPPQRSPKTGRVASLTRRRRRTSRGRRGGPPAPPTRRSAAAPDAVPFAPLLVAKECGAVERRRRSRSPRAWRCRQ